MRLKRGEAEGASLALLAVAVIAGVAIAYAGFSTAQPSSSSGASGSEGSGGPQLLTFYKATFRATLNYAGDVLDVQMTDKRGYKAGRADVDVKALAAMPQAFGETYNTFRVKVSVLKGGLVEDFETWKVSVYSTSGTGSFSFVIEGLEAGTQYDLKVEVYSTYSGELLDTYSTTFKV